MTNNTSDRSVSESREVVLQGVSLHLCGGGGVFYRDADTLLVADLHLGKGASFRKHSIAVPRGATRGTLDRVANLLLRTQPSRLFILGDLFHAPASLTAAVIESLAAFQANHCNVAMVLVRGNHDRGIHRLKPRLPIEIVDEGYQLEALELRHHPPDTDTRSQDLAGPLTLAGHVHPSFRLRSASEDLGRQRCFWYSRGCLVLPAIGEFTGTHTVRPGRRDRVWVDLDADVVEVSPDRTNLGGQSGRRTARSPEG